MEQEITDILDTQIEKPIIKKLWTIRLLLVGGILIGLTFLAATIWDTLGLTENDTIWLALSMIVSFGMNLAGFIIGFAERKKNPRRAFFGIIGNLILLLFFISIVAYSFSLIPEIQGG